jgi:hypothetical protein
MRADASSAAPRFANDSTSKISSTRSSPGSTPGPKDKLLVMNRLGLSADLPTEEGTHGGCIRHRTARRQDVAVPSRAYL